MQNEKRLIDANALRKVLENEECNCEVFPWALNNAPTVDAVEVVHGRWIEEPVSYLGHDLRAVRKKCSACGWVNACRYNYCPSCGAKMDGDGNA